MFESVKVEQTRETPVVVAGVFKDAKEEEGQRPALLSDSAIAAALARREWTGDLGNIVEAFPASDTAAARVLLVGLGKPDALDGEKMRDIAAKVGRRLAQIKEPVVGLEVASALRAAGQNDAQVETYGRCWGESLGLLSWKARQMQGSASQRGEAVNGSADNATDEAASEKNGGEEFALAVSANDAPFAAGLAFGLKLAASANLARTLSQTPPNIATPLYMAEQAQSIARESGLECRVIQGAELEAERMTGLINVGKASINPSCLIRLEYRPANAPQDASESSPLVLLGKTITYDTGGLTLKINNGMVGMKRDKDGGCAVLGAMHAVATLLKPNFPVVGLLVAAENMVSDAAFRPDDVLTYRNGVTVEVTNTDAEGRLVLADGLCWACEQENPRAIVDLATLTGGVVTALGSTYAGYFCEDARFARAVGTGGRAKRRTAVAAALAPGVPRHAEIARCRHHQLQPQPQSAPHPGRGVLVVFRHQRGHPGRT